MEEIKTKSQKLKQWASDNAYWIMAGVGVAAGVVVGAVIVYNEIESNNQKLEDTFYLIGRDVGGLQRRVMEHDDAISELSM
jgi:cobalamin biosynthesis protein CobD/CbiB